MKKTLITLIALAGMAHADFVWNGGESITQELWQTESSWSITGSDSWPSAGTCSLRSSRSSARCCSARSRALS